MINRKGLKEMKIANVNKNPLFETAYHSIRYYNQIMGSWYPNSGGLTYDESVFMKEEYSPWHNKKEPNLVLDQYFQTKEYKGFRNWLAGKIESQTPIYAILDSVNSHLINTYTKGTGSKKMLLKAKTILNRPLNTGSASKVVMKGRKILQHDYMFPDLEKESSVEHMKKYFGNTNFTEVTNLKAFVVSYMLSHPFVDLNGRTYMALLDAINASDNQLKSQVSECMRPEDELREKGYFMPYHVSFNDTKLYLVDYLNNKYEGLDLEFSDIDNLLLEEVYYYLTLAPDKRTNLEFRKQMKIDFINYMFQVATSKQS